MEILYLFIGLLVGLAGMIAVFFVFRIRIHRCQQQITEKEKEFIEKSSGSQKELGILESRIQSAEAEIQKLTQQLTDERSRNEKLQIENTRLNSDQKNLLERMELYKKEMEDLHTKFKAEFENLAGQILKKNTEELSNYNKEKIENILKPLGEKLQQFETKVTQSYEKSLKDTTSLQTEVRKLYELSQKLGEEAENLTRALKGDVKKQGNWGEIILERILEHSGLRKGIEYEIQFTASGEEGKWLRPDVIIHLPDKKHLIIDSKVSLKAYEQLINCDNEEERKQFARAHIESVRNHVKLLAGKHYQNLGSLNSPDFVLLFMPIESSFSVAVQEDSDLFGYAWDNKIVIVGPSTLLATLRTVASIWKQENQTQNIREIARQTAALYHKFVGFLEDLDKIDRSLESARNAYSDAVNKLKTGKGNLISSVEKIKKLGIKTEKNIPDKFLSEDTESLPENTGETE